MIFTQEMKDSLLKQSWEILDTMLNELDAGGMDCSYAGANYVSARENASQKITQIIEKILEQEREKIIIMRDKESSVEAREAYQYAIDSINNLN